MGSVVMPFAVFHTMHYGDWAFGRDWCDIWHAFDVLSSTASILNLCAIAVERFWATENPISYASRKTRHRCTVMLIGVWICSLTISFPAVAWWRRTEDYIADDSRTCRFTTDQLYLIVSSLVSFYIPFIVMTSVYAKIYNTASNLIKSLQTDNPDINQSRSKQWMNKLRLFAASSRVSKFVREQKAAKTLGLVMGLFVCCWLPFFICNIIVAFRPELAQSSDSFQNILLIVTWLGYVNSGINPIIYAHSMREFRRAFKRLLCTWWWLSWTRGTRSRSRQLNHHYIHQVRGPRIHKFPANMDLRLIKPDLADPIAIASNWSHRVQPQSLYSLQLEPHAATRNDRGNQSHSENCRSRRCHCHSGCEQLRTPKQINPSSTSGPPSLVKVTQHHSSPQTRLNLKLACKLQKLPYPVGSSSHLMIQQPVRELGRKCNSCMWTETYF
ncbi:uncharacterized protein DEA37_0008352 [Paragonimus westermani]|uniref:G-protein coupled receptors family 1 profile domain-containing protein n=1 Tax=Paragonimus westermani TaxID=34504 RepID=A0A5J4NDR9_9TREM|nr:uncharacterized protein DEA37_0008352 [Paragonimus westermani]